MANSVDPDHMPQNVVLIGVCTVGHSSSTGSTLFAQACLSYLIFRVITVCENSFACQIPIEGNMVNWRNPVWLIRISEEIPKISNSQLYAILFCLISFFYEFDSQNIGWDCKMCRP